MSAHMIADMPPAPAPPPKGNRRWRFVSALALTFAVAVLLAVVALLILTILPVVVDPVSIQLLPPDAVQVSASADNGRTLVSRKITDAHTVADLYARLNGLPAVRFHFICQLAPPDPVHYTFHFTRWGMPIEDAQPDGDGCYPRRWVVSRYGWWDLHMDFSGKQTNVMLAEAQLPPLPSQP